MYSEFNLNKTYEGSVDNSNNTNIGTVNNNSNNTNIGTVNKKNNPLLIVIVVVALLVVGFVVYNVVSGSSIDRRLVGTWYRQSESYTSSCYMIEFKSNHTFVMDGSESDDYNGTWQINSSNNLVLSFNNGASETLAWNESINAASLLLGGNEWYLSGDVLYLQYATYARQ